MYELLEKQNTKHMIREAINFQMSTFENPLKESFRSTTDSSSRFKIRSFILLIIHTVSYLVFTLEDKTK